MMMALSELSKIKNHSNEFICLLFNSFFVPCIALYDIKEDNKEKRH